jgi:hypothetical protein
MDETVLSTATALSRLLCDDDRHHGTIVEAGFVKQARRLVP